MSMTTETVYLLLFFQVKFLEKRMRSRDSQALLPNVQNLSSEERSWFGFVDTRAQPINLRGFIVLWLLDLELYRQLHP